MSWFPNFLQIFNPSDPDVSYYTCALRGGEISPPLIYPLGVVWGGWPIKVKRSGAKKYAIWGHKMVPLLYKHQSQPTFFDLNSSAWRSVLSATKNDPKNLSINFLHSIHNWWTLKLCRIHFGRTKICYVYNRKRENALLLIINLKNDQSKNLWSWISQLFSPQIKNFT